MTQMQTVRSRETEVQEELANTVLENEPLEISFDLENIYEFDKGAEIFGYNYHNDVYDHVFKSIRTAVNYHLDDEVDKMDIFAELEQGITDLIDLTDNSVGESTILYSIEELLESLQDPSSHQETLTFVIEIYGNNTRFWIHEGVPDNAELEIDIIGCPSKVEKGSLEAYTDSITTDFVYGTPYENRPNNRWKRTIEFSITRTSEEFTISVNRKTERVKYTLLEKLFKQFNYSIHKTEPLLQD